MSRKGAPGQRMFVAVVPPDAVIEDLDAFLRPRREAEAFRWTLAEQFHVTLAFLPSVPDRKLDDLVERLGRGAARRTSFETRVAGGGAFPNAARSKLLYAGLDLTESTRTELDRAATGARAAATRAGLEADGQRFRPHVTLARINRPTDTTNWVRLLDAYAGPTFTVDRIALVASYLGEGPRGRPRYEVVEEFATR
ncbi:MAG TPA: RNA 2',3'-cyclic phosphodiesterase [Nocardioides sp.]|nr:RNA 2',3'-cyclic phosphodiesterase [Nocardioides sp.]